MSTDLLDRLDAWKSRYGSPDTRELQDLLERIAVERFASAPELIRLHETLLFLRAYPHSPKSAAQLSTEPSSTLRARLSRPRKSP